MGAAMIAGGIMSGIFGIGGLVTNALGADKAAKEAKEYQNQTEKLIAETRAREESRQKLAEKQAADAYAKEQKMAVMKEEALQTEIAAEEKYRKARSSILTERMADKASVATLKQTLGSF